MKYFNYVYTHNHVQMNGYIYKISTYHYNWHPEVELLVVLQGAVEVCHDGEYTVLKEDDLIILSPQCGHATLALTADTTAMVIHLPPTLFAAYDSDFMQYKFCVYSDENTRYSPMFAAMRRHAAALMKAGAEANRQGRVYRESGETMKRSKTGESLCIDIMPLLAAPAAMAVEGLIMKLAEAIMRAVVPVRIRPDGRNPALEQEATFEKMIAYIDNNYTSRIDLKDIASVGGYSEGYASQFFKRQLGISFMEYVMRMRLRAAAVALVNSDDRIVSIAAECGFTDVKAFNTAFKKHFRTTPSSYRQTARRIARKTMLQDWKEYIAADDEDVHRKLKAYGQQPAREAAEVTAKIEGWRRQRQELRTELQRLAASLEDI